MPGALLPRAESALGANSTATSDATHSSVDYPVVGIGASAGGLDALTKLVTTLPADGGMAYILVQHLDPAHKSLMAGLLAEHTNMPVT